MTKVTREEHQCQSTLCRVWNHWLNPLGAWIEPLPTPQHRADQADTSWLPAPLWWAIRNPAQNLVHHWLGIVPIGARYEWHTPDERGWVRHYRGPYWSWWQRGWVRLPYYRRDGARWTIYAGWSSRGNLGFALRRNG